MRLESMHEARVFGDDDLVGGNRCLDFVNSVDSWFAVHPVDHFNTYADWLNWNVAAGFVGATEQRTLERAAARQPEAAAKEVEIVRSLRDTLHRVLLALQRGKSVRKPDLARINEEILAAYAQRELVPGESGFTQRCSADLDALDRLRWNVVEAAEALLTDGAALAKMRECPGDECGWLFLDTSKNGSRRWCSMKTCGNLEKARRHYAKARGKG